MNDDDPIRIISKIRNNRLINYREDLGLSGPKFAAMIGISYGSYNQLESLKKYPSEKFASRIAEKLNVGVDFLFPGYFKKISKTVAVRTVSEALLLPLSAADRLSLPAIQEDELFKDECSKGVAWALKALAPREEEVIKLRFGLDNKGERTLTEVAEIFNLTTTRIGQIEAKALRKLKRASLGVVLKRYVDFESPDSKKEEES